MYNILPKTKGHIVAIRVEERMTSQDYRTLLPYLKSRASLGLSFRNLRNVND